MEKAPTITFTEKEAIALLDLLADSLYIKQTPVLEGVKGIFAKKFSEAQNGKEASDIHADKRKVNNKPGA
jgi:hypothetical protein